MIGRVVIVGVLAYAPIVILLRGAGSRTLATMNAFDLIMSLGSVLATVVLSRNVVLGDGVAAFATLVGLQYAVACAGACSRVVPAS